MLHHACLRTKGRMVSNEDSGIAIDGHFAVALQYEVVLSPNTRTYCVLYVLWLSSRVPVSFIMLPLDARDIRHWNCPARNGVASELLPQCFRKAQTPGVVSGANESSRPGQI
jgi:hypothetical protein